MTNSVYLLATGECEGRSVDPHGVCYLGNDDIAKDASHRVAILKMVLDDIKEDRFAESPDIDHSSSVLKIVMMPEFFFRGPFGAYSMKQLLEGGILLGIADQVLDIIADDFFVDYLFVLGTVIAASAPDHVPGRPWTDVPSEDIEYFNFSPVYMGGPDQDHRFLVTKHYISGADFLDRSSLPNPKQLGVHQYGDVTDQLKALLDARGTKIVEDNLLDIAGLRVGIEICLDHRLAVLWDNIKTNRVKGGLVDIQLIVSAGMAIERGPNPIVPGGVVYLTDGEASSAACKRADTGPFDPDNVCRVGAKERTKTPVWKHISFTMQPRPVA